MAHRKQLGLTQDKLAEMLGVTPQAVSKWENDQSCPDITTLPQLADIFGITTDELLGRTVSQDTPVVQDASKKQEPEIESEFDAEDGDSGHGFEWQFEGGKSDALAFAFLVLAVGALTLASRFLAWDISFWNILWPCALVVFGLRGLFHHFSFFNTGCVLVGGYFLLDKLDVIHWDLSGELIFPVLILVFGVTLLVDALKKPRHPRQTFRRIGRSGKFQDHFSTDGETFTCAISFGESHRQVSLQRISSGSASCSFGELILDLTGCEVFSEQCTVCANCSFGELELLVPKHIRVTHNASTSFASIDVRGIPDPDAQATLHLDAKVNFGEIVVRYI